MGWDPWNDVKKIGKKITKETDRFLDRRVGIDDPAIRAGVIICGSALIGNYAGASAGLAAYGATGVSSVAGIGLGTIGATAGAVAGAGVASSALTPDIKSAGVDPLKPFSLPTNFELSSARGELQSVLRKKRARAKVSFTGGLQGGAGVAPRLTTA